MTQYTEDKKQWAPPTASHPGLHLQDFMDDMSMTQVDLAARLGMSPKTVNEMVKGKSPITKESAFKLSKVFDISPEFWMNLQDAYDSALAYSVECGRLTDDANKYLPEFRETYNELARLGVVGKTRWSKNNFGVIVGELQRFFSADSLEYVDEKISSFAFRKYQRTKVNPHSVAAWLQICERAAIKSTLPVYNAEHLENSLAQLKEISARNFGNDVLKDAELVLGACGVSLVYGPNIKNIHIQGATKWLNPSKVMIALRTEHLDAGRFWFNLFHEIGHVLKHGRRQLYVDFETDGSKTQIEVEADEFAQKELVPHFDAFRVALKNNNNINKSLELAAKENAVSVAIVAGRATHEFHANQNIYSLMSPYLRDRTTYQNWFIS